jgi:hypothetical protein
VTAISGALATMMTFVTVMNFAMFPFPKFFLFTLCLRNLTSPVFGTPGKKLSYWNPLCSCVFLMLNLTAAPNGGSSPMTPTIHLMNVSSHVAL